VIARQAFPQPEPPRRTATRARHAARRRAQRTRLLGHVRLARIALFTAVVLVPIMVYVMLMGNLTAMNYRLATDADKKLALQQETQRLDERIANLQSRDRLANIAAQLHMHDPQIYAVVDVPRPVATPPAGGIAFLGTLFHR
jgi:cell division protein FtsL